MYPSVSDIRVLVSYEVEPLFTGALGGFNVLAGSLEFPLYFVKISWHRESLHVRPPRTDAWTKLKFSILFAAWLSSNRDQMPWRNLLQFNSSPTWASRDPLHQDAVPATFHSQCHITVFKHWTHVRVMWSTVLKLNCQNNPLRCSAPDVSVYDKGENRVLLQKVWKCGPD